MKFKLAIVLGVASLLTFAWFCRWLVANFETETEANEDWWWYDR